MRKVPGTIFTLFGTILTLGGAPASAQSSFSPTVAGVPSALDVPYLPQSELLCGGAALAMVERWWGRRGVQAADFAGLVRPEERGIRTIDLAAAAQARGWETTAFDGSPESVQQWLAQRIPVVALIQVGHDRYHYVVLLAWAAGRVIYHDPARAPSRSIEEAAFLREWSGAERWAMILRPGTVMQDSMPIVGVTPPPTDSLPCSPWLDQAIDAVAGQNLDAADSLLQEAGRTCPSEPLVLREQAAVRFKEGQFAAAGQLTAAYLAQVPDDPLGWQLLATARFLSGDRDAALRAWNRIDAPRVDLVRIDGVRAIRFQQLASAIHAPAGTLLTPPRLALARRRLSDVPALRRSRLSYLPVGAGLAELRATVTERPVIAPAWWLVAANALRAATQREVGLAIASPTGGGELWTAVWRWEHAHPRLGARIELPMRLGIEGVAEVSAVREQFRFVVDTASAGTLTAIRRAYGVAFGGWVLPALRPTAGLEDEHWSDGRRFLVLTAGTAIRAAGDRFTLTTLVQRGLSIVHLPSYVQGSVRALWASAPDISHTTWSARLGLDIVSHDTPVGRWPVANGDISWAIPLRAHDRTANGLLPGTTTGRSMIHGGLSGDQPLLRAGPFTVAAGVFLDGVEVMSPADGPQRDRLYLDAGSGLRIGLLDGQFGTLRIDLATGLTDRHTAITVGLHQSWPPFRPTTPTP
ncbi:MAG: papain-like cysteine protease family protein [Gemmatimonadota bacterium]|nr:papain-like cysteine protease family protein [Gemmatimonadota bacterium]